MPATARVRTFRRTPAVTLAAGEVEATFLPGLGMLGASLRHGGREHLSLHGGLGAYAAGHTTGMPLLAPWANRLGAARYRSGSTTVDLTGAPDLHRDGAGLPIHGTMVGRRTWEVVELEAGDRQARLVARFAYGDHPDLLVAFPFPHDLEVAATVTEAGLAVRTSVRPTGRRPVPVAFGWHPYYRLPGARRADLAVHLPARRRLVLDDRMLPTGEEVAERAGPLALAGRSVDQGWRLGRGRRLVLEARPSGGERGADHGDHQRLAVTLDAGYPCAQVFAPAGRAFVALEPMAAPANALVTGDHPTVAPGDLFSATFTVHLGPAAGHP